MKTIVSCPITLLTHSNNQNAGRAFRPSRSRSDHAPSAPARRDACPALWRQRLFGAGALILLALLLGLASGQAQSLNQTTTFQGSLNYEGVPANGAFDLAYRLVDSADAGGQAGPLMTNRAVAVSRGVFTTEIEIPAAALDWPQRFLDLLIRPSGDGVFQPLAPRLPITPVPASLIADTARAVSAGAVTADALGSNAVTTAGLAAGAVTADKISAGQVVKSLNGLTDNVTLAGGENIALTSANGVITVNLLPFLPCSLFSGCFWELLGNANTTPAPAQTVTAGSTHHFVGTKNVNQTLGNQALELRVNSRRALRVEPPPIAQLNTDAPNLLGGYGMNFASLGTRGATIGGGGALNEPNQMDAAAGLLPHYTTIGGGAGNRISSSTYATIGGGRINVIERNSTASMIAGGQSNYIDHGSTGATISGGRSNRLNFFTDFSTIAGGTHNEIGFFTANSVISGGELNDISDDSNLATIGGGGENKVGAELLAATVSGGRNNVIGARASFSAIGGGVGNQITPLAESSVIAGGSGNQIAGGPSSQPSAIGGGQANTIQNSAYSTIAGGSVNTIAGGFNSDGGTIGGGQQNTIQTASTGATIAGGSANTIENDTPLATISGGQNNLIRTTSAEASIGGGSGNTIEANSPAATISGGQGHTIKASADNATIGGGRLHFIDIGGDGSTISGGDANQIGLLSGNSTIGGGQNNLIGGFNNLITIGGGGDNQVSSEVLGATIAGGGANFVGKSSDYSAIGGGVGNRIEPLTSSSTIAGGSDNVILSAPNDAVNTIGGGQGNRIRRGESATIPGGRDAYARHYGQLAHASGSFANAGDAQHSIHVLRNDTTSANMQELFLDGFSKLLEVPIDSTWTFEVHVVGRTQSGVSAGYKFCGVIENQTGVAAVVGSVDLAMSKEAIAAIPWNANVVAVGNALSIQVTGAAGATIRWVATVRTTEVMFP